MEKNRALARQELRALVRGAYDVQKLRIMAGNRIVINFKARLGQEAGRRESDSIDAEGQKILASLRNAYDKITEGVARFPGRERFDGDEVISSYTELCLIEQWVTLERQESRHFRRLEAVLLDFPVWNEYLKNVRGIGPAMAGVIISEIDIAKARYPSSLWKFAGLDVAPDGRGRSRCAEHLTQVEYTKADGTVAKKRSITFNPFLKTKLMGVLAGSFLRSGNESYVKVYNDYKHRMENHEQWGVRGEERYSEMQRQIDEIKKRMKMGYSSAGEERETERMLSEVEETFAATPRPGKARRHQQAMRYMVKMFLVDLYRRWREIEGLPVAPTYEEAKLGHVHGGERAVG